ncbi:MAG: hypothetical protein NUV50_10345 [Rhodospirillales bacterium]|nr:hypothetical protein [Rhodospirillales bacterium]
MSFYRTLPDDRPKTWFEEFRAEVVSDHQQLLQCRAEREARGDWSFEHAVKRTQEFYVERFTGYHRVGSISLEELNALQGLVEALGSDTFIVE